MHSKAWPGRVVKSVTTCAASRALTTGSCSGRTTAHGVLWESAYLSLRCRGSLGEALVQYHALWDLLLPMFQVASARGREARLDIDERREGLEEFVIY